MRRSNNAVVRPLTVPPRSETPSSASTQTIAQAGCFGIAHRHFHGSMAPDGAESHGQVARSRVKTARIAGKAEDPALNLGGEAEPTIQR